MKQYSNEFEANRQNFSYLSFTFSPDQGNFGLFLSCDIEFCLRTENEKIRCPFEEKICPEDYEK